MKFSRVTGFFLQMFTGGIMIVILACGSTKSTGSVKNFEELRNLVNSGEFEIESEWVNPLGGNPIYVTPGSNFIRFKDEKVEIFLPYFGVRHAGGGYGGDGGINYEGPAKELRINEEIGENRMKLYFRGKHEGEDLQFYITLYSNGNANISVNSSQRSSISYQGDITRLPESTE